MTSQSPILCPIDFSNASLTAVRYATIIADRLAARLVLLTVNDPLLVEGAELSRGREWLADDSLRELRRFFEEAVERRNFPSLDVDFRVAEGKPAPEILREARERECALIVMSTHGLTGIRKLFFGATTERVLRETHTPVLITPFDDKAPTSFAEVRREIGRVLVPVDLSATTRSHASVAFAITRALDVPLLLANVVEPMRRPALAQIHLPNVDAERRSRAEDALDRLKQELGTDTKCEGLVVYGDPAEEIAKIARHRGAGLIVMGLHSSPLAGPRMGSVTYRVLCLAPSLLLALPPDATSVSELECETALAAVAAGKPAASRSIETCFVKESDDD